MIVKLKQVFINDKRKDSTPFINKNGDAFKICNIVLENGDKASLYIGGTDINKLAIVSNWKTGDEVEIILTKSGACTNFDLPKKISIENTQEKSLNEISENNGCKIEDTIPLFGNEQALSTPKEEINPDDIPF